jgi:O-antigen ligase
MRGVCRRSGDDSKMISTILPPKPDRTRFAIYLSIKFVTCFGFVAVDSTGFGINDDDIVINYAVRIAGSLIVWLLLGLDLVVTKTHLPRMGPMGFLVAMYAYLALSYPLAADPFVSMSYLEIIFRALEWLQVILICGLIVPMSANSHSIAYRLASGETALKMLLWCFLGGLGIASIVIPDVTNVVNERGRQFGGFFIHPNYVALIAAIGVLVFGLFNKTFWDYVGSAGSFAFGILAFSRTGFLLLLMAVSAVAYARVGRSFRPLLLMLSLIVFAAMSFVFWSGQIALQFNDEELSLNDRTFLWELSWELFRNNPVFGSGFIDGPKLLGPLLARSWWNATNTQNDFLSAAVSGGMIAIAFLSAVYISTIRSLKPDGSRLSILLVTAALIYLVSSLFEPMFVHVQSPAGIVLVLLMRILYVRASYLFAKQAPNSVRGVAAVLAGAQSRVWPRTQGWRR